jgi:hypothetical protein
VSTLPGQLGVLNWESDSSLITLSRAQ